jgi:hypothetical protein
MRHVAPPRQFTLRTSSCVSVRAVPPRRAIERVRRLTKQSLKASAVVHLEKQGRGGVSVTELRGNTSTALPISSCVLPAVGSCGPFKSARAGRHQARSVGMSSSFSSLFSEAIVRISPIRTWASAQAVANVRATERLFAVTVASRPGLWIALRR